MRALVFAIAIASTASATSAPLVDPVDQVRASIVTMNKAAEKLDADGFMRSYWQSPNLTITFDGETMRGWTKILGEQRKWWSDKQARITFAEQRAPEVVDQGDGVVTSIQWMAVTSATGKKPSQLVITSVWKKLPDGWRVVLAHETLIP